MNKKKRNRLIWFTVACMYAAFWLAWRCLGSEFNVIAVVGYFASAGYITAFLYSNRYYLLNKLLGNTKKSH